MVRRSNSLREEYLTAEAEGLWAFYLKLTRIVWLAAMTGMSWIDGSLEMYEVPLLSMYGTWMMSCLHVCGFFLR